MALSKIEFIRSNGNLQGEPTNLDGVSALLFIHSEATAISETVLYSLQDLETLLAITYNGGLDGWKSILWLQVAEYFNRSTFKLYLKVVTTADTFTDIVSLKNFSNGEIKIYGIYNDDQFVSTQVLEIQEQMELIESEDAPGVALYTASMTDVSDSTTEDLHLLEANFVSVFIGDGSGQSQEIFNNSISGTALISSLGTSLGILSSIPVQVSLGQGTLNAINGANWVDPYFIDRTSVSYYSKTQLDSIDTNGFNFLLKRVGSGGTFHNFDYTCDSITSDFYNIGLNRVFNKARRLLYSAYIPLINSNLAIDAASGKLSAITVAQFEGTGNQALTSMLRDGEISGYKVTVNPNQPVLSTKRIEVAVDIVPLGYAKTIRVFLGYALSVA